MAADVCSVEWIYPTRRGSKTFGNRQNVSEHVTVLHLRPPPAPSMILGAATKDASVHTHFPELRDSGDPHVRLKVSWCRVCIGADAANYHVSGALLGAGRSTWSPQCGLAPRTVHHPFAVLRSAVRKAIKAQVDNQAMLGRSRHQTLRAPPGERITNRHRTGSTWVHERIHTNDEGSRLKNSRKAVKMVSPEGIDATGPIRDRPRADDGFRRSNGERSEELVSRMFASWNQLNECLRQIERLRCAA